MVFSLLSSLHFSPENPVPVQNKIHCRRKHPRNYGSCGNLPELSLLPGTEKTGKQRSAPDMSKSFIKKPEKKQIQQCAQQRREYKSPGAAEKRSRNPEAVLNRPEMRTCIFI